MYYIFSRFAYLYLLRVKKKNKNKKIQKYKNTLRTGTTVYPSNDTIKKYCGHKYLYVSLTLYFLFQHAIDFFQDTPALYIFVFLYLPT